MRFRGLGASTGRTDGVDTCPAIQPDLGFDHGARNDDSPGWQHWPTTFALSSDTAGRNALDPQTRAASETACGDPVAAGERLGERGGRRLEKERELLRRDRRTRPKSERDHRASSLPDGRAAAPLLAVHRETR